MNKNNLLLTFDGNLQKFTNTLEMLNNAHTALKESKIYLLSHDSADSLSDTNSHNALKKHDYGELSAVIESAEIIDLNTYHKKTKAIIASTMFKLSEDDKPLCVLLPSNNPTLSYLLSYYTSQFGREKDQLLQRLDEVEMAVVKIPFIRQASTENVQSDLYSTTNEIAPVIINEGQKTIKIDQVIIKLPPSLFAWYSWLARLRHNLDKKYSQVSIRDNMHDDFLKHYRKVFGYSHHTYLRAEEAILLDEGFTTSYMSEKKTRINNEIKKLIHSSTPYLINATKSGAYTTYGLSITPNKIKLIS